MWQEGGSSEHILGTDPLSRDILARIIYGARTSLLIATVVLSIGTLIWAHRRTGRPLQRRHHRRDTHARRQLHLRNLPFILVALVAVIVYGQYFALVIILLSIFSWNGVARQARGNLESQDARLCLCRLRCRCQYIAKPLETLDSRPHQHSHRRHYASPRWANTH